MTRQQEEKRTKRRQENGDTYVQHVEPHELPRCAVQVARVVAEVEVERISIECSGRDVVEARRSVEFCLLVLQELRGNSGKEQTEGHRAPRKGKP